MTNKEQLAYLAGLVDGEGCLSCNRAGGKCISPTLQVANTNRTVLEWCRLLFGGSIFRLAKQKAIHKQAYTWSSCGKNAIAIVQELLPHLKIKKKQAKVFIQFEMKKAGWPRLTLKEKMEREKLFGQLKKLNKRGQY